MARIRSAEAIKRHQWGKIKEMEAWQDYVTAIKILVNKAAVILNSIRGDAAITKVNKTDGSTTIKTYKFNERIARQQGRIEGLYEIEKLPEKLLKKLESGQSKSH